MSKEIEEFLEDYNSLLEGLNDEIDGIDDMPKNKAATKLSDVKLADLEHDELLLDWYYELKTKKK